MIGWAGAHTHAFVTFRSDEDRDKAIEKLDKYKWKNQELSIKKANPIPDPLVEKRKEFKESDDTKRIKLEENLSENELIQRLNDKVAPLWKVPYSEQLQLKHDLVKAFLDKLYSQVLRNAEQDVCQLKQLKPCLLEEMKSAQIFNGYRNKCEFTVGIDKTVGFRLGLYKEGTVLVITPGLNCPIIGDKMRKALNAFQAYISNESELKGFDPENHCGHWLQCTVRTTSTDSMIICALHPQQLTEKELSDENKKITEFFASHSEFGVNSVYIHTSHERHVFCNERLKHLFGEKHIYETITLDSSLKFRISPLAFFQINPFGAQICFQSIADLIEPNPELTLFDICCGTGTIGLSLASKVKKVIGIELNVDAISDAKYNAELNGISNVEYIQGKAEEVITKAFDSCSASEIVAVIDPPRAGLSEFQFFLCHSPHI